ncbi:MAG: zinc ribbon domain-containing protein, partial [Promethearchaeota archaeon]
MPNSEKVLENTNNKNNEIQNKEHENIKEGRHNRRNHHRKYDKDWKHSHKLTKNRVINEWLSFVSVTLTFGVLFIFLKWSLWFFIIPAFSLVDAIKVTIRYYTVGRFKCPRCGNVLQADAKFCDKCSLKIVQFCPYCGADVINKTSIFCQNCGKPLYSKDDLKYSNNANISSKKEGDTLAT